jgi:hypothetical protein
MQMKGHSDVAGSLTSLALVCLERPANGQATSAVATLSNPFCHRKVEWIGTLKPLHSHTIPNGRFFCGIHATCEEPITR